MVAVPFPVTSSPGARPQEGAGRLVNCFVVKTEQGAPIPIKWVRSPGLVVRATAVTYTGFRGFIEFTGSIIAALGSRVQLLTKSGAVYSFTDLGALSGTDLITVAKNNASTPDIVCVTSDGAFNLFAGSPPTSFADPDLPTPNSVCAVKGYFVWTHASGRISASDLNSISVNSLSYTMAPAGLLRGVSFRDQLFAFSANFCQVYADAGLTPFPFDLQATIPVGIAGTHAVAGWEPGFTGTLCWVAQDDTVRKLDGYTPTVISTEDVSRDIAATPDKTVLECCCYMSNGNAFFVLTRPGYWTWEHNLTTGAWNERKSYNLSGWRVSRTVRAFSTWIAGDRDTGAVFEIAATTYKEGNNPLVLEMTSGAVQAFPARLGVPRLDVNMTAAVGSAAGQDPIETNPVTGIDWSRDGGYSYGVPVLRAIGTEGDSKRSISVSKLGSCGPKGFRIRLRVSDPVPVTVMGAAITGIDQRAPG
jgi:hypothetical protein